MTHHPTSELAALWERCYNANNQAERTPARAAYLAALAAHENREAMEREPARVIADEMAGDGVAPTG